MATDQILLTKEYLEDFSGDDTTFLLIAVPNWGMAERIMQGVKSSNRRRGEGKLPSGTVFKLAVLERLSDTYLLSGLQFTNTLLHYHCMEFAPQVQRRICAPADYPHPVWLKEFTL